MRPRPATVAACACAQSAARTGYLRETDVQANVAVCGAVNTPSPTGN